MEAPRLQGLVKFPQTKVSLDNCFPHGLLLSCHFSVLWILYCYISFEIHFRRLFLFYPALMLFSLRGLFSVSSSLYGWDYSPVSSPTISSYTISALAAHGFSRCTVMFLASVLFLMRFPPSIMLFSSHFSPFHLFNSYSSLTTQWYLLQEVLHDTSPHCWVGTFSSALRSEHLLQCALSFWLLAYFPH